MQTADKNEIKKIVVEVLDEILAQTQPPDRLAFLFYNYMNDFHDFKRMVTTKFNDLCRMHFCATMKNGTQ